MIEFDMESQTYARMKVIGVGGAGGNAINRMIEAGLVGVRFVAVNTDSQALDFNLAPHKVQIGAQLTKGLGAGADPEIGLRAAEESIDELKVATADADMVFVTCGMGGGTGTGAAPVIARLARESGALVVGVVTKPFLFEGAKRIARAEAGIAELRKHANSLIVIPNQRLLKVLDPDMSLEDSFRKADEILYCATKGIASLITRCGLINLDFADVRTVMSEKGEALMGTGYARGEGAAERAARMAISSPLLEDVDITGARGVLVNIAGGRSLTLVNVSDAMETIYAAVGGEANIIFGAVVDNSLDDGIHVTVIATGFGPKGQSENRVAPPTTLFGDDGGLHPPKPRRRQPAFTDRAIYKGIMENEISPDMLEKPAFERYKTARPDLSGVQQELSDQL